VSGNKVTFVLVVEDSDDNREILRYVLRASGYGVLEAANGKEAIEICREKHPDLILMDLGMPEMDGWEATEKIRADSETSSIMLYAITAHTLPRDRYRALQAGCDGYISKPIHVERFLGIIEDAFDKINGRSK